MPVKHGSVARPLTVRASGLPAYKQYLAKLIERECPGKARWSFDTDGRIHLVVPGGKPPDAKRPPKLASLRFIHEVQVQHEYERPVKGKDKKEKRTEGHEFFFDVTKILPPPLKHKLEIEAGLIGRGKKK